MPLEYETFSQREKIENKDQAKILDYFERQGTCIIRDKENQEYDFLYGKLHIEFSCIELTDKNGDFESNLDNVMIWTLHKDGDEMTFGDEIMNISLKAFSDNLTGLYASLNHYTNN